MKTHKERVAKLSKSVKELSRYVQKPGGLFAMMNLPPIKP